MLVRKVLTVPGVPRVLRVLVRRVLTVLTVRWVLRVLVLRVLVLKVLTVLGPTVLKVPVVAAQEALLLAIRHPGHL